MIRELRLVSRRTPLSLFTAGAAIGFFAVLTELIAFLAFQPDTTPRFRFAMIGTGLYSLPAVVIVLAFALRTGVRLRQSAWNVLLNLGCSERAIRKFLFREHLMLAILGLAIGALLIHPVWWVLLRTIYSPYRALTPDSLALGVPGALVSVVVLLTLVLVGHVCSTRRICPSQKPTRDPVRRSAWLKLAEVVFGLGAAGFLLFYTTFGNPILSAPLLGPSLAFAAPALGVFTASFLGKLLSNLAGSQLRLGMLLFPGLRLSAALRVAVLAIGLPLALLGFGATGEFATRVTVASHATSSGRLAVVDGAAFMSAEQARSVCNSLDDKCAGVLEFVINTVPVPDKPGRTRQQFELIGARKTAEHIIESSHLSGQSLGELFLLWPWRDYHETMPDGASPYGAWVVIDPSANIASISAEEGFRTLPGQLYYGVNGTGSREFVPILSYTLFAGLLFLFVTSIVEMVRARTAISPLGALGMSTASRDRAAAAALLVPVTVSSIAMGGLCLAYCFAVSWRLLGSAIIDVSCLALPTSALLLAAPTLVVWLAYLGICITRRRSAAQ